MSLRKILIEPEKQRISVGKGEKKEARKIKTLIEKFPEREAMKKTLGEDTTAETGRNKNW